MNLILHNLRSLFVREFVAKSITYSSPLFVCTDNAATMHLMDGLIPIQKFTDLVVLSTGYQHALLIASAEV